MLLDIYLKKMKTVIQKDIFTSKLTTALFTIAKLLILPKCPSIDKWIEKEDVVYIQWNIIQT